MPLEYAEYAATSRDRRSHSRGLSCRPGTLMISRDGPPETSTTLSAPYSGGASAPAIGDGAFVATTSPVLSLDQARPAYSSCAACADRSKTTRGCAFGTTSRI